MPFQPTPGTTPVEPHCTQHDASRPVIPAGAKALTLEQAAERWQVSIRTLRRRIAEGRLTAYRHGRAIRLKPEDVDALFTPTNKWSGGAA